MAKMIVTRINEGFAFNAMDEAHNTMRLDIPVDQGGHGTGLRPMQTLLSALGACSGVDIVMILNKQKEGIEFFEMEIDGEREANKEPALWSTVHILFKFKGTMSKEKAEKACALSIDKYCSVAATLRAAGAVITWHVEMIESVSNN
ncbi:MAG: OsmC family protein [Chitinophagia bacterium]|jgi:putative redox protein